VSIIASPTTLFLILDKYLQTFNEIQKLLVKTNGKVVGDLMTSAPLFVRESTNLEDAARYYYYYCKVLFLLLFTSAIYLFYVCFLFKRVFHKFVSVYFLFSLTSYF
jgi:hypothetical protein